MSEETTEYVLVAVAKDDYAHAIEVLEKENVDFIKCFLDKFERYKERVLG